MMLVSSVRTSTTHVVNVCDEVRVARAQHRDAITGGGFLLKRHIGPIPITVYHVTTARYRHARRRCLPRHERLSRALIHDSVARIITSLSPISTVQQNIVYQLLIQRRDKYRISCKNARVSISIFQNVKIDTNPTYEEYAFCRIRKFLRSFKIQITCITLFFLQ